MNAQADPPLTLHQRRALQATLASLDTCTPAAQIDEVWFTARHFGTVAMTQGKVRIEVQGITGRGITEGLACADWIRAARIAAQEPESGERFPRLTAAIHSILDAPRVQRTETMNASTSAKSDQ